MEIWYMKLLISCDIKFWYMKLLISCDIKIWYMKLETSYMKSLFHMWNFDFIYEILHLIYEIATSYIKSYMEFSKCDSVHVRRE